MERISLPAQARPALRGCARPDLSARRENFDDWIPAANQTDGVERGVTVDGWPTQALFWLERDSRHRRSAWCR
jgi:hypothetical protein